jgi:serine/threonine-protein kinase
VGSTFAGRYRIDELLGEGGSATVFKCTDLELNESVAIKLFKPTAPADAENQVARFKLELSLSRQLAHPNIIRLFDLGQSSGWRYLTLELLQGADLMTVIERVGGPLPLDVGLRYLIQVCDGLQAAHEKGVVHRDIKPQNIFVTAKGQVKLMDFGLAKRMAARGVSTTGMVAGTPEYISPEQINGFSSVTHLTDLYALGATAYTMFTFAPPFYGMDLMPRLEAVMLKLLEKDPAKRVPTAEALGSELSKILDEL